MWRINVFFFLSFFFCQFAASQNFGGGIVGGLSISQVDGDTYSGYNKAGAILGLVVDKKLGKRFALAMEMKFLQKGTRASYDIETGLGEYYSVRLNYVQLPVLAQYNFWSHFWGELGLAYGYLINFKEEDDYGEIENPVEFKKSELAVILGVAFDIPKTRLRINARATNSVFPVRTSDPNAPYVDMRANGQYNRNLEFGLMLFLGKRGLE